MNATSRWYTVRTALIAASLPIAGIATSYLWVKPSVELATQVIAYFLWAVTFVTARHQVVYLAMERAKRIVFNTTCRWSFTGRFELPESGRPAQAVLEGVVRRMLSVQGSKLLTREGDRAHLHLDGTTVSVRIVETPAPSDDDEESLELVLDVLDTPTPYRYLKRFFERRLDPLIEDTRRAAHSTREKYELAFSFPVDANPYLGLLVRRMRPGGDFRWTYSEKTEQNGNLLVTRDRLELATFNAAELRMYFKRFVGLALEAAPPR